MNRYLNIARAAALAGLCSGCIVWSAGAFAADYDAAPQGSLTIHPADFNSPGAVAHLKHKLQRVAANICLTDPTNQGFTNSSERACYETAVKDGLTQIGARQQALRERTVRLADANSGNTSAQ